MDALGLLSRGIQVCHQGPEGATPSRSRASGLLPIHRTLDRFFWFAILALPVANLEILRKVESLKSRSNAGFLVVLFFACALISRFYCVCISRLLGFLRLHFQFVIYYEQPGPSGRCALVGTISRVQLPPPALRFPQARLTSFIHLLYWFCLPMHIPLR